MRSVSPDRYDVRAGTAQFAGIAMLVARTAAFSKLQLSPDGEIAVATSCIGTDGRVDCTITNDTPADALFDVSFATLDPRVIVLGPGLQAALTITVEEPWAITTAPYSLVNPQQLEWTDLAEVKARHRGTEAGYCQARRKDSYAGG